MSSGYVAREMCRLALVNGDGGVPPVSFDQASLVSEPIGMSASSIAAGIQPIALASTLLIAETS